MLEVEFKNAVEFEEWLVSYNNETELSQVVLEDHSGMHQLSCCETGENVANVQYCRDGRVEIVIW